MANPSTINQSIATLKAKGYTDAEIQAIQFSVPRGDNRRATALFQAAQGPAKQQQTAPAPPAPPKPIQPPTSPQTLGDDNQGSRLKINKKSKRKRSGSGSGTGSLRINLNAGSVGASAGGVNLGGG